MSHSSASARARSHALELIERIVREADCPVIAVLEGHDAAFVNEAAKRGVFAYIVDGTAEELQSALDITLRRFAEYHNLQGAFGRRAQTERAKGILMERYQIDERQAFEMLRDHARHSGQKLDPRRPGRARRSSPARLQAGRLR